MRKLWDDERLHHQFQLVERATGKVLEDSGSKKGGRNRLRVFRRIFALFFVNQRE
jgi:hypothetical protein